jgi:hypothetical protein
MGGVEIRIEFDCLMVGPRWVSILSPMDFRTVSMRRRVRVDELDAALPRPRYGRRAAHAEDSGVAAVVTGHRHGRRVRTLTGTFGKTEIAVPRARLNTSDGKTTEWKSQALRNYQRRTLAADALIAGTYLAGTNTRRVRRALSALPGSAPRPIAIWPTGPSTWNSIPVIFANRLILTLPIAHAPRPMSVAIR